MNRPVYFGVDIGDQDCRHTRESVWRSQSPCGSLQENLKNRSRESLRNSKIWSGCYLCHRSCLWGSQDRLKGEILLSPPNLPGWDRIKIVQELEEAFRCRAYLMNDANAGALAEWKFGAGDQSNHMVFITAGTGFGAGLIINGALVEGASGSAGEIGHVRLAADGPVGYGKAGSAEGFCSGGGIAQLAQAVASAHDGQVAFNRKKIENITTKDLAEAAQAGDAKAIEIFNDVGYRYGEALAVLIDVLNPEKIVLGSIFARCRNLIEPSMRKALDAEALSRSAAICEIMRLSWEKRLATTQHWRWRGIATVVTACIPVSGKNTAAE